MTIKVVIKKGGKWVKKTVANNRAAERDFKAALKNGHYAYIEYSR